ncbi:hypothetical protein [Micromonospora sp. I033]
MGKDIREPNLNIHPYHLSAGPERRRHSPRTPHSQRHRGIPLLPLEDGFRGDDVGMTGLDHFDHLRTRPQVLPHPRHSADPEFLQAAVPDQVQQIWRVFQRGERSIAALGRTLGAGPAAKSLPGPAASMDAPGSVGQVCLSSPAPGEAVNVSRKIRPVVAPAAVEFFAEGDRGLELGSYPSADVVRRSQAGEPANLVCEEGLKREQGQ